MTVLRFLAFLTIAAGVVLLTRVVGAISAEYADGFRMPFVTTAILANALGITLAIAWVACSHLKRPSRSSALRLVAAAATSVWFLWPASGESRSAGLLAALLLYFLVFRRAAKTAFRDERKA